jgi:hypothetical protein
MMMKRLIKEESGMAMAIALMVMVIIGVMGAGLLVFVTTDLGSVVESNQGQKALNLADAGVQAAKAHLMTNSYYQSYDGVLAPSADPPNFESTWSCGTWDPIAKTCSAPGKMPDLDPGSGNSVKVWIQYLQPATTPAQANDSTGVYAPEVAPCVNGVCNYPIGKDYLKVMSQSTVGQTKRKIEAIYHTYSLDAPRAYFTPGSIKVAGGANIKNISLFALGNVTFDGGATVSGKDLAYGKWAATDDPPNLSYNPPYNVSYPNTFNNKPRGSDAAGVGAAGNMADADEVAGRDYDVDPNPGASFSSTNPQFVLTPSNPQSASQITFPFNPNPNLPSLEDLATAAQAQSGNGIASSNYYEVTDSTPNVTMPTGTGQIKWPEESSVSTVVYVKFTNGATPTSNTLLWDLPGVCGNPDATPPVPPNPIPVRGTLVVENGTVKTSNSNKRPLKGVIIVRGVPPDPSHPAYESTGNSCMQVFANASGDIKLAGSVTPGTYERGNVAGTFGLRLWSWRECYNVACTS